MLLKQLKNISKKTKGRDMKFCRNLLVYLLIAVLTITCIPPMNASAASNSDLEAAIEAAIKAEQKANGGIQGRLEGNVPDDFYGDMVSRYRLKGHDSRFDGWTIRSGIDVSHHQGVIDWKKVAADGIEFAFVRVAGRGYGTAGNLFEDALYKINLEQARAAGLDVGVYIYSQATTQKEARDEAAYILERIKGYDINLPVVFDYEYYAGGRLSKAKLTNKQRTDICRAFCEAVKFAGYEPMIYANKSMLKDDLNAAVLSADYKIWLAHYTTATDYQGEYTFWQHTSQGSVNGINGNVDMNYHYVEPGLRIGEITESSVSMEWTPVAEAEGYILYRKPADKETDVAVYIDDPAETSYTDFNVVSNRTYSYELKYYVTDENGETVICESGYPVKTVMTPLKLQKVKLTAKAVNAGAIKLTWGKEPNATGYIVQQYDAAKKTYVKIATVLDKGKKTVTYTKSGLTAGKNYKFRVCALADVGGATIYGNYSTVITAKTPAKLTKPVLTAKPFNYTTNKLTWKKIPGATAYQIQRYNYAKKKWVLLKTVKGTATKNTYLKCKTNYRYRIRAIAKVNGKTIYSYYSVPRNAKTKGSRIGVVKNGPLKIRKGPGKGYKKLTVVKKGRKLTITGSTAKWYRVKIKINGKFRVGYVSKQYVRLKTVK